MGKKVPVVIALAALSSEFVFNERHEPAVHQPHTEVDLKMPVATKVTANASVLPPATGGRIHQIGSSSLSLPTHEPRKDAPVQPHIEGGGNDITDFTLNQIA